MWKGNRKLYRSDCMYGGGICEENGKVYPSYYMYEGTCEEIGKVYPLGCMYDGDTCVG